MILRLFAALSLTIAASGTEAAIVTLTEGAEVLEDPAGGHDHDAGDRAIWHAGAHDPHAWQSVPNARAYVATIADAFCTADAEGCDGSRANADRYGADLDALDAEIRKIRDRKAGAIFAENIADTRLLDRIAAETDLPLAGTFYSDALSGPDGPAPDDLSRMRHNAQAITAALSE